MHKINLPTNQCLLGFDFGLKHLGIAVGQPLTKSASALTRLKVNNGIPNWDELGHIIKEWQPSSFVVGVPLNMDGTKQKITHRAETFMQSLETHFQLPTYGMDERLSSREAKDYFYEAEHIKRGKKRRRYSEIDTDSIAAKFILESFLNENC